MPLALHVESCRARCLLFLCQAKYVDPEKALEAKERGNEQFRAGQWALAINEYEEVRADCCVYGACYDLSRVSELP